MMHLEGVLGGRTWRACLGDAPRGRAWKAYLEVVLGGCSWRAFLEVVGGRTCRSCLKGRTWRSYVACSMLL